MGGRGRSRAGGLHAPRRCRCRITDREPPRDDAGSAVWNVSRDRHHDPSAHDRASGDHDDYDDHHVDDAAAQIVAHDLVRPVADAEEVADGLAARADHRGVGQARQLRVACDVIAVAVRVRHQELDGGLAMRREPIVDELRHRRRQRDPPVGPGRAQDRHVLQVRDPGAPAMAVQVENIEGMVAQMKAAGVNEILVAAQAP